MTTNRIINYLFSLGAKLITSHHYYIKLKLIDSYIYLTTNDNNIVHLSILSNTENDYIFTSSYNKHFFESDADKIFQLCYIAAVRQGEYFHA